MVAVTWQFQAQRRALQCVADFSICPVLCLQTPATLQPGLPPKTTASCCLSALPGCGKQMDRDSWLSKFWCSGVLSRLLESVLGQPCRCFSGSYKIQSRLEMNGTATMGVSLCWADEVETPTPLCTLPQQCVEHWAVFLVSRQVQFLVTSKGCWMKVFMNSLPVLFLQQCMAEVRAQTDELQRDLYYKIQKAGKKCWKWSWSWYTTSSKSLTSYRYFRNTHRSETLI